MSFKIRAENAHDHKSVRALIDAAFNQGIEAELKDRLCAKHDSKAISLIAEQGDTLVGQVLFSPSWIEDDHAQTLLTGYALGPVSVLPSYQKQGVGSALIHEGLAHMRKQGACFIMLLGHLDYYPRFGFQPAHLLGIQTPYPDAPLDAFMIIELVEGVLNPIKGIARFDPVFNELG